MTGPLTVVIATRDRPGHLASCLASLGADLRAGDEVVVVDSASATPVDESRCRNALQRDDIGIRVVRAPRPGTSLARNLGWRTATHRRVAFVDDDVAVHPGWADAISAALDDSRAAATDFVTGWIGVPREQQGVAEPTPLMLAEQPFTIDRQRRGLLGAGANFAATRAALEATGGFDERLGPGNRIPSAEDHDLIDRLLAAGFTGRYEPAARVDHDQWRTTRQALTQHWRMGLGAGARLNRLARADRARFAPVAKELVVDDVAAAIAGSLRSGYQTGTVFALLRLLGMILGALTAPAGRRSIAHDSAAAGG